jgi:demethylmenaquinone methyltransferase/2-methoxy-6-polyprenyl-1,4-benzoquinol methylase
MSDPDPRRAVAQYRRRAAGYDASARRTMAIRRLCIELLELRPGDRVLDVACGTGLSFALLAERVGPGGEVVGVELSPEMAQRARARMAGAGWPQVRLVESPMEEAALEGAFDALLFHYTHDVLQSPRALANVFAHAKPGARVAVAGVKHPPAWLFPQRWLRLWKARPYLTTYRGLDRPWAPLERFVHGITVRPMLLGTNYVACGRASANIAP